MHLLLWMWFYSIQFRDRSGGSNGFFFFLSSVRPCFFFLLSSSLAHIDCYHLFLRLVFSGAFWKCMLCRVVVRWMAVVGWRCIFYSTVFEFLCVWFSHKHLSVANEISHSSTTNHVGICREKIRSVHGARPSSRLPPPSSCSSAKKKTMSFVRMHTNNINGNWFWCFASCAHARDSNHNDVITFD